MKKYYPAIFITGALLILSGAAVMVTQWAYAPYLYSAGALMVAAVQFMDSYEGSDITMKRLRKQQVFGAILLLLTGVFMFTTRHNEWVVCLTIAAILELYAAFRMSHLEGKEKKQ